MTPDNTTPRPWHLTPLGYLSSDSDGFVPICTPFREDAHRDKHRGPTPQAYDNAALIVCAVNAHDDLVAALAHALEEIHHPGAYAHGTLGLGDIDAVIAAALAKARARP